MGGRAKGITGATLTGQTGTSEQECCVREVHSSKSPVKLRRDTG